MKHPAMLALSTLVAATSLGCSSDVEIARIGAGGSAGASGNSSPTGGTMNPSASGAGGTLALMSGGASGQGGGPHLLTDLACATSITKASLAGLNMLIMFDRSVSMLNLVAPGGPSRWEVTSAALKAFFASPSASGLDVGLRFFPHDEPAAGCRTSACDVMACAQPLVGLGSLMPELAPADQQERALLDAIDSSTPIQGSLGGTPTSAALAGALTWAKDQHLSSPADTTIVVLVTDGEPSGCDLDGANIAKQAGDAFMTSSVRTYTIGLTGSGEDDLNQIALAGGTAEGIFVSDGDNTQQALLDALVAIHGQGLDCDVPLPSAPLGERLDPMLVNVNLTLTSGGTTTLAQVPNEEACITSQQGWHYDDPTSPSHIVLCKSSCDGVSVDPAASLEILLGCQTVTEVPRSGM